MNTELTVLYSCEVCRVADQAVDVPSRSAGPEDVVKWMEQTVAHVARDHRQRSPLCQAIALTALKIPMNGERVGEAP